MSSSADERSPFIRFCDAFLREENIKWMLGLGVLVLLGSSLRLVTTHWSDYTPVWKYLILLAYSAVVYGAGEFSYFRLGLRRTGTVLMALTVLLVPITFLALHWIRPEEGLSLGTFGRHAGLAVLMGVNLVLSGMAAHRIFSHFLRGPQPTFLASYLTLCVAGAVVPGLPEAWSPVVALALWAVFTAGTVKVNRHVFWLTEEHRLPRICGFFPIALLGGQFLAVFAMGLAPQIPMQWFGLACALVALPVLLTADAVARVFQQRTGDLVRPLPWSIIGPLVLGTGLCCAGFVLAATGWPRPYAMVPTAALAAVLFGMVAHRTRQSAFVWVMLAAILCTYQFTPVFCRDLALMVAHQAAAAVGEQRLPLAFYGLTYLPLVIAWTIAGVVLERRGARLFTAPLITAVFALPCLLLAASWSNPKALLPVGLGLTGLFALQTALLGQRRFLFCAIAAFLTLALGVTPFVTTVLGLPIPPESSLLCLTIAAGLLLYPGFSVDQWFGMHSVRGAQHEQPIVEQRYRLCQRASLALLPVLAGWGLIAASQNVGLPVVAVANVLLIALLVAHTLTWLAPVVGEGTLCFATLIGLVYYCDGYGPESVTPPLILGLLGQWLLSYVLELIPQARVSRAFAQPLERVSRVGLAWALLGYVLPHLLRAHFTVHEFPWIIGALSIFWAFDAARRTGRSLFSVASFSALVLFSSAALVSLMGPATATSWIPVAWALTGGLAAIVGERLDAGLRSERLRENWFAISRPVGTLSTVLLCLLSLGTLAWYSTEATITAALALSGLLFIAVRQNWQSVWPAFALLGNCHLISFALTLNGFRTAVWNISPQEVGTIGLPLAALTVLSLLAVEWSIHKGWSVDTGISLLHRLGLMVACGAFLTTTFLISHSGLSVLQVGLAGFVFLGLALAEGIEACRTQDAERAWHPLAVAAAGLVYLMYFGVIHWHGGVLLYAALGAAFGLWIIGHYALRHPSTRILAEPFLVVATGLPLVTVGLGVWRHIEHPATVWKGANTLALLASAAFYFWQGLESHRRPRFILSATILNLAIALLWRELHWTDPQLFMIPIGISVLALVELLRQEIPPTYHNPLRYVGALVILVSPTFDILGGSWLHLFTLMSASVAITLFSIGLRVRALMYTGTAFLAADLVAMLVRGSIDRPNVLWVAGTLLGIGVIALAAVCERHREDLLTRLRLVAAELESWE